MRILVPGRDDVEIAEYGQKNLHQTVAPVTCPACRATLAVPILRESFEPSNNVEAANAIMQERNGCPSCKPDLDWDVEVDP